MNNQKLVPIKMLSLYALGIFLMSSSYDLAAVAAERNTQDQAQATLDPQLVGSWSHTEFYNSSGFSYVRSQTVTITPDGKFMVYEPTSFASGGGTSLNYSERVLQLTVAVQTKDLGIYLIDPETGEIHFLFRYVIEGSSMVFIDKGDNKKLWKRI